MVLPPIWVIKAMYGYISRSDQPKCVKRNPSENRQISAAFRSVSIKIPTYCINPYGKNASVCVNRLQAFQEMRCEVKKLVITFHCYRIAIGTPSIGWVLYSRSVLSSSSTSRGCTEGSICRISRILNLFGANWQYL